MADSESERPPPLLWSDIYPSACPPLIDYIAEPLERNTPGCVEMNQQINPYYPFGMREEYN